METIINSLKNTVEHIQALHETFANGGNFHDHEVHDFNLYQENLTRLNEKLTLLNYGEQLYAEKGRQMILSDFFEYVFFGRVYYSLKKDVAERGNFIASILSFVNLLMSFETITVSDDLRIQYLRNLVNYIPEIANEPHFNELLEFRGKIGLPRNESDANPQLDKYFDSLLPKTAGGLWHELLVYIFLLRNDCGYIIPLLLSQRLIGLKDNIVPPDFLLLSREKRLYGIEVGIGKEVIQSSTFVLRTAIPTATVDTLNSRTDRCPICHRWIQFCPHVIDTYSDISLDITSEEVRCLSHCTKYSQDEITSGICPYTKYKRNRIGQTHTHHDFANGYHYHYQCVLNNVNPDKRAEIINARDVTALKTHYPYYAGLEGLLNY